MQSSIIFENFEHKKENENFAKNENIKKSGSYSSNVEFVEHKKAITNFTKITNIKKGVYRASISKYLEKIEHKKRKMPNLPKMPNIKKKNVKFVKNVKHKKGQMQNLQKFAEHKKGNVGFGCFFIVNLFQHFQHKAERRANLKGLCFPLARICRGVQNIIECISRHFVSRADGVSIDI